MPPQQFGNWVLQGSLSEGGQAWTYLVHKSDDPNRQPFVLKRLKNLQRIGRFQNEVNAGLALSHPNILQIVDQDLEHDPPFFVSEYCAGGPLSKADIDTRPLVEQLRMFSAICRAVGYAHLSGIIHRDLKPDNIFLRSDQTIPVVGDFGICFIVDGGERLTLTEEAVGARLYMAPECEDGRLADVGPPSDVYSLGKVLYYMVAGRIFSREQHRAPDWDIAVRYPDSGHAMVNALLDRCIVFNAEERIRNADLVADEVDSMVKRILMNAHPIGRNFPQECTYCGMGKYSTVIDSRSADSTELHNSGWNLLRDGPGPPFWRVQICDFCGNVQWFRPQYAEDRDVWDR